MSTPYARLRAAAENLGFTYVRTAKSSHEIWQHPDTGRKVSIPHGKRRKTAIANIQMRLRHAADSGRLNQ